MPNGAFLSSKCALISSIDCWRTLGVWCKPPMTPMPPYISCALLASSLLVDIMVKHVTYSVGNSGCELRACSDVHACKILVRNIRLVSQRQ